MKVAIPSLGKDLNSSIDQRFGRARYYIIADSQSKDFKAIENPAAQASRGAGVAAAQIVNDQSVSAVIVSFIGPNSHQAFQSTDIKVYQAKPGSIEENLDLFNQDKLDLLKAPTGPPRRGGRMRREGRGRGGR